MVNKAILITLLQATSHSLELQVMVKPYLLEAHLCIIKVVEELNPIHLNITESYIPLFLINIRIYSTF
jgi:hypothetical protein